MAVALVYTCTTHWKVKTIIRLRNSIINLNFLNVRDNDKVNSKTNIDINKKLSYCWETVRRESMPRIAEMDVEMTT